MYATPRSESSRDEVRDVGAAQVHAAAAAPAQAVERLDELGLAIAGDSGDAEDLAGPDLEAGAVDHDSPAGRRRP